MTNLKPKTTFHKTGAGEVLFMVESRALHNKYSKKDEFSVRIVLDKSDEAIGHLLEINDAKINNKTNADRADGSKVVNFTSTFKPEVTDVDGNELTLPNFFDGRKDKATAVVGYAVIEYPGMEKPAVRLKSIQILDLNMAPREGETTISKLENDILATK